MHKNKLKTSSKKFSFKHMSAGSFGRMKKYDKLTKWHMAILFFV